MLGSLASPIRPKLIRLGYFESEPGLDHTGDPADFLLCRPSAMDPPPDVSAENRRRMEAGELYYAFTPDLLADRRRCGIACARFNSAGYDVSRRRALQLWKE